MRITRRFTQQGQDVFDSVQYEKRTSRITNPDGSVVFEMKDAEIPASWSQLATDIMVSKYFRKAGVPVVDEQGNQTRDERGNVVTGPEKSTKQVIHRLAGCWRYWGEKHGYFDTPDDAQAFCDEIAHMLLRQMCAPNSPQWFNTGLQFAYGITGPAQGHYYCDPKTGEMTKSRDAYSHPQIHACFIQSITDDLVNGGGIMDLWTREARIFKYGSGSGTNYSKLRGENEPLSGGGKSSGLMSFLRIGDRAAGAIKSGGTTRRAAKMVCLDLDHPDIEMFVNWKVREELKVAAMVEGLKILPAEQKEVAKKLGLRLDYDFNGEAYQTVSGQNSNNSVRVPNRFFKALEEDGDWHLTWRTNGKVAKTVKARELWDQIAYAAWRCADPGVQYDDTINQWHTCPRSGRINASNPCVTGDTRVLTPGGIWRRIDQMIHLPSRVVTNIHENQFHPTEGSFPTANREVYELRTAGGYSIKLTADHKVYTRTRGWIDARELTTDDELRLLSKPATMNQIGEPQDPRFFQLLGLFVSAANNDATALHLDNCLCEHELIEEFGRYVSQHWGERAYDDDYVNELMVDTSDRAPTDANGNTITATLTNRRLLSRLKAFLRNDSSNGSPLPRLGDEAFTTGLAAQKHLLRALFTADAVIENGTLMLHHESAPMLQDVQLLLIGFGVQSTLAQHSELSTPHSVNDGGAVAFGGLPDDRRVSTPHPRSRPTGSDAGSTRDDAAHSRHGLRVDPGSLRAFGKHLGLLRGAKLEQLARLIAEMHDTEPSTQNYDRFASLNLLGKQQVFDLTEPRTSSFVANGITIHNCSEYMFLDDTACNLASLNVLTFFDPEHRSFDVESFKHAIRLWTIVLEISVLMASFPSEEIARRSYKFRTLGLGYANLGEMLMQSGIPYDSPKARAICAGLSAILTGESYATSSEMARELGSFPGYAENEPEMLRVIRNHRRAAYDIANSSAARRAIGDYEMLDLKPVGIDESQFDSSDPLASKHLLQAARECWDRSLLLGERHGYRNAQATCIAPTGTIGLLMDCDTTGVEPDFALVKFKKLAGGGYFKIANQSLRPALVNLGYSPEQINDILKYVMGTLSLHDAPHINWESLTLAGFKDDELERIEHSLPGVFELSFAFSPWSIGADFFTRMEIAEADWQAPGFNLLRMLGFSKRQIDEANDAICGHGTVEGAPHLKPEHYAVFDCANKCGKHGSRFIDVEGHIRMMGAAQPFISGAISKTINLPNEATLDEIRRSYELSWRLGLKANALYRDGSKLSQPLNVKSDTELDQSEEEDQDDLAMAREEVARDVAKAASAVSASETSNVELVSHTNIIEKIVERIVERPLRRRLPDTRNAITHKFDVAGHEGYITVGLYDDGSPGEVFITMAKEGSTIGGLMDTVATLVSVALQYGVPVESLVRKFEHVRFEPAGMTRNLEIPMAKSLVDYIFRWLAMEFVPGYRAANAPKRPKAKTDELNHEDTKPRSEELSSEISESRSTPPSPRPGNGHRPRIEAESTKGFDYPTPPPTTLGESGSSPLLPASGEPSRTGEGQSEGAPAHRASTTTFKLRTALTDPLSQQSTELQSDAPACDVCGAITVRNGTCYKCLNCGNSMGCS